MNIHISARSQRSHGILFLGVGFLFFSMAAYFAFGLIDDHLRRDHPDYFVISCVSFIVFFLLSLDLWLWNIFHAAKELTLQIKDHHLHISGFRSPIPLQKVNAEMANATTIGVSDGVAYMQNAGNALIITIEDFDKYRKLSWSEQMLLTYQIRNRLQLLTGRMLDEEKAQSFLIELASEKQGECP